MSSILKSGHFPAGPLAECQHPPNSAAHSNDRAAALIPYGLFHPRRVSSETDPAGRSGSYISGLRKS